MHTQQVNLAVIGSGSGNSLITPFWDDKLVAIAEQGVFGGTCLNVGCIPTKMFVRPAALARTPEEAARLGVTMQTENVDWVGIRDRVFGRIDPISAGGESYRIELPNIELVSQRVQLDGHRAFVAEDGTRVEAEQLVIAAGSRAVLPDIPGIDLPDIHTSDTVMRIDSLPKRVLVIGGGYIACEFAGVFSGLGSEVVQLVRGDRMLRSLDDEIAEAFTKVASKRWSIRFGCEAERFIAREGGGVVADLSESTGAESLSAESSEFDVVLLATGRRPNSDLVGAEEAGLDLHADGRIKVDEYQRVLVKGVPVRGLYALGDVSSPFQLKHVANHEARVVAHNLEHPEDLIQTRHHAVPAGVFSDPEIAQVGLTEKEAISQIGAEHVTTKTQHYGDTAYGWAMEDEFGVCKVIADRRDGTILGAHIMGYQASNLIQVILSVMSFGIDAHTAARGQYWIHPALSEVVENALLGLDVPEQLSA
ncbi:MAG: mycothione reductase [Leucobacter sp.]